MPTIDENTIKQVLKSVIDPLTNKDLVTGGMLSGLAINDGHVLFTIEVDPERGPLMEDLRQQAEKAVADIDGVQSVQAILTAERKAPPKAPAPLNVLGNPPTPKAAPPQKPIAPHVKHIIAVASGKGGVGKSTVAVNLAAALSKHQGLKVGLMDADVYGPSVPKMLGLEGEPIQEGNMLLPMEKHGLKVMSMGSLVDEEQPIIWRGPKVQTAVLQFLRDVEWGELDVLVVDMPPGTGDAQLTMAQKVPLSGAVIVSTPQDIALLDAVKGVNMFYRVDVPILGMIENMSQFCCPNCDHVSPIFGQDGAKNKAKSMKIPFLGDIPLHGDICNAGDTGAPFVLENETHPASIAFIKAAATIKAQLFTKKKGKFFFKKR